MRTPAQMRGQSAMNQRFSPQQSA